MAGCERTLFVSADTVVRTLGWCKILITYRVRFFAKNCLKNVNQQTPRLSRRLHNFAMLFFFFFRMKLNPCFCRPDIFSDWLLTPACLKGCIIYRSLSLVGAFVSSWEEKKNIAEKTFFISLVIEELECPRYTSALHFGDQRLTKTWIKMSSGCQLVAIENCPR